MDNFRPYQDGSSVSQKCMTGNDSFYVCYGLSSF